MTPTSIHIHHMQLKSHAVSFLSTIAACTLIVIGGAVQSAAQDQKVDPTGTWTWSTPGRSGGEPRVSTLKLKAEGEKLTGSMSTPGRGGQAREFEIKEGKVKGDEISFVVTREFGGNSFTAKYNGKVTADTIKGKIEVPGRDGQPRIREWEAKREKK